MPTWRIYYRDGHTADVDADWCDEHATGWTFQSVRWVVFWARWVVDLATDSLRLTAVVGKGVSPANPVIPSADADQ